MFEQALNMKSPVIYDTMMDGDRECARWIVDTLQSVLPLADQSDARLSALGDFETLPERIEAEISAARSPAPWLAMVGWSSSRAPS